MLLLALHVVIVIFFFVFSGTFLGNCCHGAHNINQVLSIIAKIIVCRYASLEMLTE